MSGHKKDVKAEIKAEIKDLLDRNMVLDTQNSELEEANTTLHERCDTLRSRLDEADKEERRLTDANVSLQLSIYNAGIEISALFQALHDCQKVRKDLLDEVQRRAIV